MHKPVCVCMCVYICMCYRCICLCLKYIHRGLAVVGGFVGAGKVECLSGMNLPQGSMSCLDLRLCEVPSMFSPCNAISTGNRMVG